MSVCYAAIDHVVFVSRAQYLKSEWMRLSPSPVRSDVFEAGWAGQR
jgi:hypothetical protein